MSKSVRAALIPEANCRYLLQKHWDVVDLEIGANRSGGADTFEELDEDLMPAGGFRV
jgi:hypothetical protein